MIEKVISGGQVGADIAGLRAAKSLGVETGGFMPFGWLTLDGPKPVYKETFGMVECSVTGYSHRTKLNVKESDGTIRFAEDWNSYGELATLRACAVYKKPSFDVEFDNYDKLNAAIVWVKANDIKVLNVAGNAKAEIESFVFNFMEALIWEVNGLDVRAS